MDNKTKELVAGLATFLAVSVDALNIMAEKSKAPEFPFTGEVQGLLEDAEKAINNFNDNVEPVGFYL